MENLNWNINTYNKKFMCFQSFSENHKALKCIKITGTTNTNLTTWRINLKPYFKKAFKKIRQMC